MLTIMLGVADGGGNLTAAGGPQYGEGQPPEILAGRPSCDAEANMLEKETVFRTKQLYISSPTVHLITTFALKTVFIKYTV